MIDKGTHRNHVASKIYRMAFANSEDPDQALHLGSPISAPIVHRDCRIFIPENKGLIFHAEWQTVSIEFA